MENLETTSNPDPLKQDFTTEAYPFKKGNEQKEDQYNSPETGIKSINLSGDKLTITAQLSGVFCQGVQYYDLKNILFINNTGMANLIDLLKSLLKQGVEVRFVNVNEKIRSKIKVMGLDHILICS